MEQSVKKPYESKTIVVNGILGVLVALAPFLPFAEGASQWITSHGSIVGGFWAVMAIALRFITKDAIVLKD